jgi:hypothetical protein
MISESLLKFPSDTYFAPFLQVIALHKFKAIWSGINFSVLWREHKKDVDISAFPAPVDGKMRFVLNAMAGAAMHYFMFRESAMSH